jgi:two-component system, NtrC family, sensor histidine kinase PilS
LTNTASEILITDSMPARGVSDSLWRSLRYFGVYRVGVAMVFLAVFLLTGGTANLASQDPSLFLWANASYLIVASAFMFAMQRSERAFGVQLSIQVACDILFLTLLMYASGGARSGIAFMLVVVVAGAGLVGQGRMTLFYAAIATLAVLLEHSVRIIRFNADVEDFVRVALTSIGFFATALIAQLLARRVLANERLAQQRGVELAEQVRITRQVIHDMEDGVLVVNAEGRVRLHNPRAEVLLGLERFADDRLAAISQKLAEHVASRRQGREAVDLLRLAINGRSLQVRLLSPENDGNTLIYLQDIDQIQNEARQQKLAALGRLTANIAHEIRNPLAAVSHAAELLADEQRLESRQRLVRIIVDNTGRLNRLVGEVLELGRRDRAQPEAIHLADFLQYFLDEYSLHAPESRQRINVAVTQDDIVCFDRSHLHRVLENLITNALRYASSDAGAVQVKVEVPAPKSVVLHIIDDGPGIAEAERGKVFEPFFTTHGSGTGLGLYIARELCEANGASLELVEAVGGAHFRIVARGGACPQSSNVETEMS